MSNTTLSSFGHLFAYKITFLFIYKIVKEIIITCTSKLKNMKEKKKGKENMNKNGQNKKEKRKVYEGGSKSPCNHLFSLHMGAFTQRWQCLHQV